MEKTILRPIEYMGNFFNKPTKKEWFYWFIFSATFAFCFSTILIVKNIISFKFLPIIIGIFWISPFLLLINQKYKRIYIVEISMFFDPFSKIVLLISSSILIIMDMKLIAFFSFASILFVMPAPLFFSDDQLYKEDRIATITKKGKKTYPIYILLIMSLISINLLDNFTVKYLNYKIDDIKLFFFYITIVIYFLGLFLAFLQSLKMKILYHNLSIIYEDKREYFKNRKIVKLNNTNINKLITPILQEFFKNTEIKDEKQINQNTLYRKFIYFPFSEVSKSSIGDALLSLLKLENNNGFYIYNSKNYECFYFDIHNFEIYNQFVFDNPHIIAPQNGSWCYLHTKNNYGIFLTNQNTSIKFLSENYQNYHLDENFYIQELLDYKENLYLKDPDSPYFDLTFLHEIFSNIYSQSYADNLFQKFNLNTSFKCTDQELIFSITEENQLNQFFSLIHQSQNDLVTFSTQDKKLVNQKFIKKYKEILKDPQKTIYTISLDNQIKGFVIQYLYHSKIYNYLSIKFWIDNSIWGLGVKHQILTFIKNKQNHNAIKYFLIEEIQFDNLGNETSINKNYKYNFKTLITGSKRFAKIKFQEKNISWLEIYAENKSSIFCFEYQDTPPFAYDNWFQNLESAKTHALENYGVTEKDWITFLEVKNLGFNYYDQDSYTSENTTDYTKNPDYQE